MLSVLQRVLRPFALLLAVALVAPVAAKPAPKAGAKPVAARSAAVVPWLYRGSDIPVDREWVFGELPNGLRYAVRKNGVPPGQVSIRVAIDAGSLNETPKEGGYAHFNEHLSFRGSKYVPDGEAIRTWQRLGATFGSDTNASTTPTQTIYKLDLPAATPQSLGDSIKILSGMMSAANMTQAAVDTERRTVLAELRERSGPAQRAFDASATLFFAGQPFGRGNPSGTVDSLNAATLASLSAFRDRWYRPEFTTIAIAGDFDPQVFADLIKTHFGDWRGKGPKPPAPDFGKPDPAAARVKVLTEPGLPTLVNLAVLRPWYLKKDTVEYNRGKLIESLSLRLISRRLEQRARAGGSFLSAEVDQDDVSRSVDGTFIQIVPLGDDWQAAVRDVRAVIADALVNPSSQDDIDREANEFLAALQAGIEQARTQNGGRLADDLLEAVNIRETVASPQVAYDVFSSVKPRLSPAAILAATRRMFTGAPMRALLTSPTALPGAEAQLLAAMDAAPKPLAATAGVAVTMDRVPKLGVPGVVTRSASVGELGLDFVDFANGTRAMVFANPAEAGRIYVSVRFGRGMLALPSDRATDAWAAPGALIPSGIGDLKQDDLDRLTSGRRINLGFAIADDAFVMSATTRAADLDDQLRLMAAKLAAPGWDPAPVVRARAAALTGYAATDASPQGVFGREVGGLLRGGDPRWSAPTRVQIEAMTPESFRALWEPLLRTGPVEVSVFGDIDREKAVAAIAASFGAMPARAAPPVDPASAVVKGVAATATPVVRTHKGPADQAMVALAWPLAGGQGDIFESRKLDIVEAIFSDRLFNQLREGDGASYSPGVSSNWPVALSNGGSFLVTSQLRPANVDRFFALVRSIAADLAATPPSADELARAVTPLRQQIRRASSGNSFWLNQLQGATADQRRLQNLGTLDSDYARVTPADVQATAKRWLVPDKAFAMTVVPEVKP